MKKLTFLLAFLIALFTGCEKSDLTTTENQSVESEGISTYVLTFDGNVPQWEAIILSAEAINSNYGTLKQGNSAHTHGDFHGYGGTISFSGTQNNGGTHGSAEIQISGLSGNLHIKLETASVVLAGEDGNEAVYGGLVTEVIENTIPQPPPRPGAPPPACDRFELGTYVYFAVIDNGQGVNASPDQYSAFLYPICTELADGGLTIPWFLFGWIDLTDPSDKIKVNE